MPHNRSRYSHTRSLLNALNQYQGEVIIPHCQQCSKPCCKLTDVVLEFDWRHLVSFYEIKGSQKAFDRSLRDGTGPVYIRKQAGLYYTHGSPCPAYDEASRRCRHYQSRLKPENCSDFPLYLDEKTIVADGRCEAIEPGHLLARLRELYPAKSFVACPDREFPFLIYIECS